MKKYIGIIFIIALVLVVGYFAFRAWLINKVSVEYDLDKSQVTDLNVMNLFKMYKAIT